MTTISPERIAQIEARRDELQALMATGELPSDRFVSISKEYAELEPVAQAASEVRRLRQEADSLAYMAEDTGDEELRSLAAEELRDNARALEALLAGTPGPYRDAVLFNAAATLIVADRTEDWTEGAEIAAEALDSGKARTLLESWIAMAA